MLNKQKPGQKNYIKALNQKQLTILAENIQKNLLDNFVCKANLSINKQL
jgi:hypothetical protein